MEVKLQRNALSVLEAPTGNEDEEGDENSFCSSSDLGDKENECCKISFVRWKLVLILNTFCQITIFLTAL